MKYSRKLCLSCNKIGFNDDKYCIYCGKPFVTTTLCPVCEKAIPSNSSFCSYCNSDVINSKKCTKCHKTVLVTDNICPYCGENLSNTRKCNNCNQTIYASDNYCARCGIETPMYKTINYSTNAYNLNRVDNNNIQKGNDNTLKTALTVSMLILAFITAFVFFYKNKNDLIKEELVKIPDVTNSTYDDALNTLLAYDLSVKRIDLNDPSVIYDCVIKTEPSSNSEVKKGTEVVVYVSNSLSHYYGDNNYNPLYTIRINKRINTIKIRSTPTTINDSNHIGNVYAEEIYDVYETIYNEGYTWHRIGQQMWIADDGTWTEAFSQGYINYQTGLPSSSIGSTLTFGLYEQNNINDGYEDIEWIVLDNDGSKMLLVSMYCLDSMIFDNTFSTWNNSDIRQWLNDVFYYSAFSAQEQSQILTITNTTELNNESPTSDRVFLLSSSEVEKYWPNQQDRICYGTAYAFARGAEDFSGKCRWWLRTLNPEYSAALNIRTTEGRINYVTPVDSVGYGVRPAIWVKIDQ